MPMTNVRAGARPSHWSPSFWRLVRFCNCHPLSQIVLPLTAALLWFTAIWTIFRYVPDEQVMGAVQRIFYVHVSAAIVSYLLLAALFVGSVYALLTRKGEWDLFAESAAGVGLLLCSAVLISGMIWGHSAWNTWWRWEPRLVSFLVLWLVLVSYKLLRVFSRDREAALRLSAIVGILASLNVPVVMFSVKFLQATEQLHPQVLSRGGLHDSRYLLGLVVTLLAMTFLAAWMLLVRFGGRLVTEATAEFQRKLAIDQLTATSAMKLYRVEGGKK